MGFGWGREGQGPLGLCDARSNKGFQNVVRGPESGLEEFTWFKFRETNKQTKTSKVGFHSKFSLMAEFEETLKLFCPSLVLL